MGSRVRIRLSYILHFVMMDFLFPLLKNLRLPLMIGVTASDRGHRLRITHTHAAVPCPSVLVYPHSVRTRSKACHIGLKVIQVGCSPSEKLICESVCRNMALASAWRARVFLRKEVVSSLGQNAAVFEKVSIYLYEGCSLFDTAYSLALPRTSPYGQYGL